MGPWIVEPLIVLPLMIVLFGAIGFIPRRFGRRWLRLMLCVSALVYLMVLFPPTITFAEKVLAKQNPHDTGITADAVVILGRGNAFTPSRVEVAAKLWQEQRAPLIFASGVWDAPKIVQGLHATGIPIQFLDGENCSRTTYENAKFTAEILKPQGVKRIVLVTDAPHMLRSRLTFEKFGFMVIPVASPDPSFLNESDKARLVLREYAGLVTYSLMGRLSAPQASQISLVPSQKR